MRPPSFTPPSLTPMSRLLVRAMDATARWSRPFALLVACAALILVTAVDYLSGAQWSVGLFYMLACMLAAWSVGERAGFALAVLSAFAAAAVRHAQLPPLLGHAPNPASEAWNLCARILSFGVLAAVAHGFGSVLAVERWRATRDALTGVLNRAGFERAMTERIRTARERGGNLLLAYIDLDGFKAVNDQHGHATGDHVLRAFSHAASGAIRPTDLFARIGGDEFAALLTLPPSVDGHRLAELLHQRLTAILARSGFDVTCSMGAVFMGGEDAALDHTIMKQADALMYEVKRAGKNALRVARGTALNKVLREAFPPQERDGDDGLDELLRRIDHAERRQRLPLRRVA